MFVDKHGARFQDVRQDLGSVCWGPVRLFTVSCEVVVLNDYILESGCVAERDMLVSGLDLPSA